jgi:endonuclease/exonuclease/phosphatase family metal-dependent hydrolase
MAVRFATFNVENFFARPKVFSLPDWAAGQPILDAFAQFNALIERPAYTAADTARMIDLLLTLEVYRSENGVVHRNRVPDPAWAWLRANRGTFDVDHADTGIEIVATGRGSWTGWAELATAPTGEVATQMTAKVITTVDADVLCVAEAEDRPSLDRFNRELLAGRYGHCMLIDGNDPRGIDVGLLTKPDYSVVNMRSNVDVPDPKTTPEHLFSRDCAMYQVTLPGAVTVWMLLNHFKSKSGTTNTGAKRKRQADGVRGIVDDLLAAGETRVIVLGDLNEGPNTLSETPPDLGPLYDPAGPLVSVYDLPGFDVGPRPGTFGSCRIAERFDHILVSRALAPHVTGGGIERHGLWGTATNKNPPSLWDTYPQITAAHQAASDHAAVYIDTDL